MLNTLVGKPLAKVADVA
ncbi:hypothetical protein IKO50_00135 [bacterium]|nr:hypothetical protein [bacterium]MBR7036920.1 hypothetical protein [bacterium]